MNNPGLWITLLLLSVAAAFGVPELVHWFSMPVHAGR